MNDKVLAELLKETGVILDGHFLLTSGRHSGRFMQCSQLLQYPVQTEAVCKLIAEPFMGMGINTVIGPAMGGIILSYEVARQLGVRAVYTEQFEGQMVLRRGFSIEVGEKVLVVEDAVTTGGSVKKVLDILRKAEANIAGISVMVDRSDVILDFGVPMKALLEMEIESYSPEDCPLCKALVPLQRPKS
ncbi:MAG: orotate phosphoribosyltransferase [Bacillota bacterium]|nr:orotate phosphoribosyltransferase [Bacillota bacterium]MDW7730254.1 orotate phosphoribosyltransferase [Bacillota bacterium]